MKLNIIQAKSKPNIKQSFFINCESDKSFLEETPHEFCGNIELSGTYIWDGTYISIECSLRVPVVYVCDRCGEKFQENFYTELSGYFEELSNDETLSSVENYSFFGNFIDLSDMVRDGFISNFPTRVLCKKDCKGICPICGDNLNLGKCSCGKKD